MAHIAREIKKTEYEIETLVNDLDKSRLTGAQSMPVQQKAGNSSCRQVPVSTVL